MLKKMLESTTNLDDIVMEFVGASTDKDKKFAMKAAEALYKWISENYKRSDIGVKIVNNSSQKKINVEFL